MAAGYTRTRLRESIDAPKIKARIEAFALGLPDPHHPVKEDEEGRLVRCEPGDPHALPCAMTADQLRAGLSLLAKVLPDLRAVEFTDATPKTLKEYTTEQLQQIAAGIMPEGVSLQ